MWRELPRRGTTGIALGANHPRREEAAPHMPTISIQLYTLREALEADRTGTLATVAAMGVDEVEPFGIENSDWLPNAPAAAGLKAGSSPAGIVQTPEKVLAAAKTLGVKTVFQPSPMPRDAFESVESLTTF